MSFKDNSFNVINQIDQAITNPPQQGPLPLVLVQLEKAWPGFISFYQLDNCQEPHYCCIMWVCIHLSWTEGNGLVWVPEGTVSVDDTNKASAPTPPTIMVRT
jgi:hypothetical protein